MFPRHVILLLLVLVALAPVGCGRAVRADRVDGPRADSAVGAADNLARLAVFERASSLRPPAELPPPPGMDPAALARHGADDLRPQMTLAEALADLAGAEAALTEAGDGRGRDREIAPADRERALHHYAKGREAALQRRHLQAITEFQKALDLDAGAPVILKAMARSYVAVGNRGRAVAIYRQLLVHDPGDLESRFLVGLSAAGRNDDALAAALLGRPRIEGRSFGHDPAADVIAAFEVTQALRRLEYDRASIDAAATVLGMPALLQAPTVYGPRYGSVYRRRGEIWRSVGDAHCRLGEYEQALAAYTESASLPTADPSALDGRVVYANLQLGRVFGAQRELLGLLATRAASITDREIALCAYTAAHATPTELLVDAVTDLHADHPTEPGLARAAATFLPRDEALALLRRFIDRQDTDLDVLSQFLTWLARDDEPAALEFVATLCADRPDRSSAYVDTLAVAVPRPLALLARAKELPDSPERAHVECGLQGAIGAVGRAWHACAAARRRWPEHASLLLLQLRIAAALKEPALIADAIAEARGLDTPLAWRLIAQAELAAGRGDAAVVAARSAVAANERDAEALTDLARILVARAQGIEDVAAKAASLDEAIECAERALVEAPDHDEAYEVLLAIHGPGGPRENASAYREAGRRLFERHPESPIYARAIAREAIGQRRYDRALERVLGVYESNPADRQSLGLAIVAWQRLGELEAAEQWLGRRLEMRPGDPALLEQHVRVQLLLDRADATVDDLTARLGADPDDFTARRLLESAYRAAGRAEDATRLARARLLERPQGVVREMELAVTAVESGDEAAALEHLDWFADHADEAGYESLVRALLTARRLEGVAETLQPMIVHLAETTVSRFPAAPLQIYGLGLQAMARSGRLDARFDELARRAAAAPGGREPTIEGALQWRELAQELVNAGHPASAARALRARLLADDVPLDPVPRSVLLTVAIVAHAAAKGSADATIASLRTLDDRGQLPPLAGMEEAPTLTAMLYEASQIFASVGAEEGGDQLLVTLLEVDPNHVMAMNNLGYMRIDADRNDPETIDWIERAHGADPENGNILDTVGWLRYKQGRLTDGVEERGALGYIEAALDRDDPSAEVLDHLGDTYWRLGRREEALQCWQDIVNMLGTPQQAERGRELYRLVQERNWMLLVADPADLYDRALGGVLRRARGKVAAVERARAPTVAGTFDEAAESDAEAEPDPSPTPDP